MELNWQSMALWLLAALLIAAVVSWWRAAGRVGRENRRRQQIAARGEQRAEALAEAAGFTVVDRQVTQYWDMQVGDAVTEVWCRADLLLQRGDLLFVGEVKTGDRAPEPTHPATRRQLLEYRLAFEVDGALLIDVSEGRLVEIRFPGLLDE